MRQLTDDEILEYLMTSEFREGLNPDEFRFLLAKFRNFYRIIHSRNENLKSQIYGLNKEKKDLEFSKNNKIQELSEEKNKLEEKYNNLKSKKLSLKERIFGKIIIIEDESK